MLAYDITALSNNQSLAAWHHRHHLAASSHAAGRDKTSWREMAAAAAKRRPGGVSNARIWRARDIVWLAARQWRNALLSARGALHL